MVKKRVTFDEQNLKENEKYLKSRNFKKITEEKTPFRKEKMDYDLKSAKFESESTDANNEGIWSSSECLECNTEHKDNDHTDSDTIDTDHTESDTTDSDNTDIDNNEVL
ncbi:hypothetical protein DMUE_3640 [Dictyocoela muelleri]|nr:hypothetical protein DMUE_3640 [Dictyocoela muelleri]